MKDIIQKLVILSYRWLLSQGNGVFLISEKDLDFNRAWTGPYCGSNHNEFVQFRCNPKK